MYINRKVISFLILLIISLSVCNSCRFESLIKPLGCECGYGTTGQWISCKSEQFSRVIDLLSADLEESDIHFEELYLESDSLENIGQNFLKNLTFKVITFHNCTHLKHIDKNAFEGIQNHILQFEISGSNDLTDPNIFEVISKMKNLRKLQLSDTKLTSIPSNAFNGLQSDLTRISFDSECSHSPIKRVSKRAFFQLNNLIHLDLSCLQLEELDSNAFEFKSSSNPNKLFIDLSNNQLTEKSFENNFKIKNNRNIELILNYNPLKYINQSIFGDFLDSNSENSIKFWQNTENSIIDCNSCETIWLKNYSKQISDTFCSDGQRFLSKNTSLNKCPENGKRLKCKQLLDSN